MRFACLRLALRHSIFLHSFLQQTGRLERVWCICMWHVYQLCFRLWNCWDHWCLSLMLGRCPASSKPLSWTGKGVKWLFCIRLVWIRGGGWRRGITVWFSKFCLNLFKAGVSVQMSCLWMNVVVHNCPWCLCGKNYILPHKKQRTDVFMFPFQECCGMYVTKALSWSCWYPLLLLCTHTHKHLISPVCW